MAKSILPYVVLGASAALDNPNINLLFSTVSLKDIYPSPFILSVLNVPLPPSDFIEIGSSTWESITGRPLEITDAQVTNGVGTDEVLLILIMSFAEGLSLMI
jgi:hypothetical protein